LTTPSTHGILYESLTTKNQPYMNLLKTIINQMGYLDAEQCEELACYFPNAELIIQWGYLPREACRAVEVAHRIKEGESLQGDYVRSVWFNSSAMTKLREVLGISPA